MINLRQGKHWRAACQDTSHIMKVWRPYAWNCVFDASIPLHRFKMRCPIITRSHSTLGITQIQPMYLLQMPRLERIMQPSRIYFTEHWAHPTSFFILILLRLGVLVSVHTVLNHPLYTSFRKQNKKEKALCHNCRSYYNKCISVQRFLCFRFTRNAITFIIHVCSCRRYLGYKTQPYPWILLTLTLLLVYYMILSNAPMVSRDS